MPGIVEEISVGRIGAALPQTTNPAGESPLGRLALFSTITVFGTPVDVTLAELALETFLPADAATAQALRRLATSLPPI